MKSFTCLQGVAAVLRRDNVDTDVIIPKQFMKTVGREGLGPFAFDAWRYLDEGALGQDCSVRPRNPEFVLNQPQYADARILVAGKNFGCGSSREHAVWALADLGIEAIVAESYGDIFRSNCMKNGLLPVVLPPDLLKRLAARAEAPARLVVSIDLRSQTVSPSQGEEYSFNIEDGWRERLLHGWDDISLTLQHSHDIRRFEQRQREQQPWLYGKPAPLP